MNTLEVPVVLAFTPNYFVPACTTILSILKVANPDDQYVFICLLTEELSVDQKRKLESLVSDFGSVSYFNLNGYLAGVYVDERYTIAASFRLLLPDLLPQYDRVIYLDCDIIVRNNLASLFEKTFLGNNFLAAVDEPALPTQIDYLKQLNIEPGYYFNSGFLIFHLKQMRLENLTEKLIEGLRVPFLLFPDQDVLNLVCRDRVVKLAPRYNSIRVFYLPQYKKVILERYNNEDRLEVLRVGNIHYTGEKPWNAYTIEFNAWWKMYEQLPVDIQSEWKINSKIYRLHKLTNTVFGGLILKSAQALYRKVKYS